ncbi:thioesterase domain-containing protein [uncultured Shewanella sp.]|uniref:thioesterase II family protein n=1 Tax=uncultured Shewanella sp. TaxID=173975 RepID=UPI0026242FBC|nr:thioesterase domain-containing protein [uncultured Shewanella sp.]
MSQSCFILPHIRPNARLRLFCFPYAGGSAAIFKHWQNDLPNDIELVYFQPPGRSTRIDEPPAVTMEQLISELMKNMHFITEKPYAFFGHSLGSRVAFELALQLQAQRQPLPKVLIASGSRAPHVLSHKPNIAHLEQAEFVHELKKLNGTSSAVLQHEELMSFLYPMLKADFSIAESYVATGEAIRCPIHVFSGCDDDISEEQLLAWQDLTSNKATLTYLQGDHFFIDKDPQALLSHVNKIIIALL